MCLSPALLYLHSAQQLCRVPPPPPKQNSEQLHFFLRAFVVYVTGRLSACLSVCIPRRRHPPLGDVCVPSHLVYVRFGERRAPQELVPNLLHLVGFHELQERNLMDVSRRVCGQSILFLVFTTPFFVFSGLPFYIRPPPCCTREYNKRFYFIFLPRRRVW